MLHSSVYVSPREIRFPAQTEVEGQAAAGAEIVLNIETDRLIADILGLAGSLAIGLKLPKEKARQSIIGDVGCEAISTEFVKQVVFLIHPAQVSAKSE